jgi:UDP-N-acetylglucosamine 2-epimerase (non-hydrolysing)
MRILSVIGGRPNLIKVASIYSELRSARFEHHIVDVGVYQKPYGPASFRELGLPEPNYLIPKNELRMEYLDHLKWLAAQMKRIFQKFAPDVVLVYGDINPTAAASIAAAQLHIPAGHVEAGLRNYDIRDTEEFNRLLVDKFAKFHFATTENAKQNLLNEGFEENSIHVVGNTITNALKSHLRFASLSTLKSLGLPDKKYGIVTFHREENIESFERLQAIYLSIKEISCKLPLVFIQYVSTLQAFAKYGFQTQFESLANIHLIKTISYHEYLGLLKNALLIITDSSGIQDEAAYLGVPCIICRDATHKDLIAGERYNYVVGLDRDLILKKVNWIYNNPILLSPKYPLEWDINVGIEIAAILTRHQSKLANDQDF